MQTIIFDVDGTLISTEDMYMKSLDYTLRQHGIEKPYSEIRSVFGLPGYESLIHLKVPNPDAVLVEWKGNVNDFADGIHLYNGIFEMLSGLKDNGQTLGIVTSNTPDEFAIHHDQYKIEQFFSDFVFAGMTSNMKPFADPILLAMQNLKANPKEAIYIGDSVHDMGAAHNAGIKFGMAAWGVPNQDVFENQADVVFETPKDLLEWMQLN